MLKTIIIENYALIDSLQVDFGRGLSIITGETGAGKSILLGALSLALGQRADIGAIKNAEKNCVVEATFELDNEKFKSLFEENDIAFEQTTIFRRLINANGKSRAFINDIPVNISQMKTIGEKIVDIHSQHQNLLLVNNAFQLAIVDIAAKNAKILQEYKNAFGEYKNAEKTLAELEENAVKSKSDYDYLLYQNEQITVANVFDGEQESLEDELNLLAHAEEIKTAYTAVSSILSNDETSIHTMLNESISTLRKAEKHSKIIEDFILRLESCKIEVADIAAEIDRENDFVGIDAERQEFVQNRLDTIYSLQQKFKVSGIGELLKVHAEIKEKLDAIENFDFRIDELKKEKAAKFAVLCKLADELTKSRRNVVPEIEKNITAILQKLGMPNAVFAINISENSNFTPGGKDEIVFLFSANKEVCPQEISKVASGGEISRLMLSLKSLIIESGMFPTIIFDEIDTGISGDVADKTGDIICKLAQNSQIINITHLPQIASKGDAHYFVFKEESGKTTTTNIRLLSHDERVGEIAKMLSGSNVTQAAIENAKELLNTKK